ncbi:hypothetical protein DPMN_078294 [Dreissena polymorpha]|uniref:Uncharacterized protein n=1 Tax=Dreissena polymorpha TaxID=45954 RepID=A0A9D4BS14_DREPO|nr:hypothetical protein DPMN_078294 [Dreissena polymorpha]
MAPPTNIRITTALPFTRAFKKPHTKLLQQYPHQVLIPELHNIVAISRKGYSHRLFYSVILFKFGTNIILRAAQRETRRPLTNAGIRLPANADSWMI